MFKILICLIVLLNSLPGFALEIKPAVNIDRSEVEQLKNSLMYYQSGNESPRLQKYLLDKTVITIYKAGSHIVRHAFLPLESLNYNKAMSGLTKEGYACGSKDPAFSLAAISPLGEIIDKLTIETSTGNFYIDLRFPTKAIFFPPNPKDKFNINLISKKCAPNKTTVFILGDMRYMDNRLIDDVSLADRKLVYDFWQIKP